MDPRTGRPKSFGDPARELRAAAESCVIVHRSHLGRIVARGRDILDLLHRLTTADLRALPEGSGRPTVVTTPKGRVVERLFVHHLSERRVLLVTGPGGADRVLAHLRRFTFSEDTGLEDDTGGSSMFALLGSRSREIARSAGLPAPDPFGSQRWEVGGTSVHVLGHDGFAENGLSLLVPRDRAAEVWVALRGALAGEGVIPAGDEAVEAWRILAGLPESGHELTEDCNPLEVGLWIHVSFDKGCYVGQEVIARLRTYDRVTRSLVGLVFPAGDVPPPGAVLRLADREMGRLTSSILPPGASAGVGLALVRNECTAPGTLLSVSWEGAPLDATVASLPISP